MRLLVTGGAGFIGSATVRVALDLGHTVTVLDSLVRGHRCAVDARARLVVGSVGDSDHAEDALSDVHCVIHCAGYADVAESVGDPALYVHQNVSEPAVLLGRVAARGVPFIFSSSASVYGEPRDVPISESAASAPINPYGHSKLAFERSLAEAEWSDDPRWLSLRYFNAAGALMPEGVGECHRPEHHLIPSVVDALSQARPLRVFGRDYPTRDGTCVRDYVHVRDLAHAHLRAAEHLLSGGESGVVNLGGGNGHSNLEVIETCASHLGVEPVVEWAPRRPGDPSVLIADIGRAREWLGWCPVSSSLPEIVADAVAWHVANPVGYV